MAITTNAASSSAQAAASAAKSQKTIAANFDQFLLLLTTQLQNQNPLEPLDTNQFTQQLVQFASVEQQIQTNQTLSSLLSLSESSKVSNAVSFLGAKVVAEGSSTLFTGDSAEWAISTSVPASRAIFEVRDVNGNVIASNDVSLTTGTEHKYVWDGTTTAGGKAPVGIYTLSVQAFDASGARVAAQTDIKGVVDGIDLTGAEPVLKIGDLLVPMSLIKSVTRA